MSQKFVVQFDFRFFPAVFNLTDYNIPDIVNFHTIG